MFQKHSIPQYPKGRKTQKEMDACISKEDDFKFIVTLKTVLSIYDTKSTCFIFKPDILLCRVLSPFYVTSMVHGISF